MSIKISNLKSIEERYKNYLEAYFEHNSAKYLEAIKQYSDNKNGLVGFSGENSVVRFSVIINPDNDSFVFEQKDKYTENQTKNYKEAKEEVSKFIQSLKENVKNQIQNINRNDNLSNDDINIVSLIESIEKTDGIVDFGNDMINLDFHNTKNYKIDKETPIISTGNLFSTYQTIPEISLNDLKNIFTEMIDRDEKVSRFNQNILETASSIYTDVVIEESNDVSNKKDFGFSPRPSF